MSCHISLRSLALVVLIIFSLSGRAGAETGAIYQVAAESALLRDYPSPNSGILMKLENADQVEYLASSSYGWWKVRSLRTGVTGWMTSDLLKQARADKKTASSPKNGYFFVNTSSVDLKIIPLVSAANTGTVRFNEKLQKLSASPSGWTKVRNPRSGIQGWLHTRFLSPTLVAVPQAPVRKKKMIKASGGKKKKKVEPAAESVEEPPQPM